MKNLLTVFALLSVLISCTNNTATSQSKEDNSVEQEEPKHFGEKIDAEGAVGFEELMTKLSESDSAKVKLAARVTDVCQKKGCWMNLVDADDSQAEPIFVKFKDYAFFMPKDLAGSDVVVEGVAYKSVTPVDELRHYAEDAGKSEEEIAAITEPEEELKFMASGVVITNRVRKD
ncbi:MAG: DUF4920 domain-containing protein [Saprospiraceae bacterium]|nr:DUF4920 domain-containing protein [Saprospiraceae bacterium]